MRVCWDAEVGVRAPCGALSSQDSRFLPISRMITRVSDAARGTRGGTRGSPASPLLLVGGEAIGWLRSGETRSRLRTRGVTRPRADLGGMVWQCGAARLRVAAPHYFASR